MERRNSSVIVRHVRDLKRTAKAGDTIIGKIVDQPTAVRILIGNFIAGAKMTTVRWELYGNFELTVPVATGRFDPRDLLGEATREELAALAAQGIVPAGDWDFDAFIPLHQCPSCRGVANAKFVLYVSSLPCERCSREATMDESKDVVKKLMVGYQERLRRIAILPTEGRTEEFGIQSFVDPIPNSVMCWLLARSSDILNAREQFGVEYHYMVQEMYQRSLFTFLTSEKIEESFHRYLVRLERGSWKILVRVLRRVGEAFRDPYGDQRTGMLKTEIQLGCALVPQLVNHIILHHADVEARRRQRQRKPRKKGGAR
jgi:hypothetical protein